MARCFLVPVAFLLLPNGVFEPRAGHGSYSRSVRGRLDQLPTAVVGLSPRIVWHDGLFYDLVVVLSDGLLIGTVLTLGALPMLYSLAFRENAAPG